jgi:hypothetical protein
VRKLFYRLFGALGRAAILFQNGVYGFGGAKKHYQGFESPFPLPWQALSAEQRRTLVETAEWNVRDICPTSGFKRAQFAYIGALAQRFTPKSVKKVFGDRPVGLAEFDHAGGKLRAICPNLMYASGTEILLVEIKWGEFTNEQLVQHFSEWLKENEPEGIKRPDRRGHKLRDLRVGLERLGIMRLLSHFTLREMPLKCPAAWKAFGNREWYKERRRAVQMFHGLLPFLPGGEQPASLATKASRSK